MYTECNITLHNQYTNFFAVPPRWRVEPVHASAVVGDSIVFDCQAEGYPQPLIRWKKSSGKKHAL